MEDGPQILAAQWLTPERLRWVLDISESTLADWQQKKLITGFKCGRVVRFPPETVMEFILRNSRRARTSNIEHRTSNIEGADWGRIERLIEDQVKAQLELRRAA